MNERHNLRRTRCDALPASDPTNQKPAPSGPVEPSADDPSTPQIEGAVLIGEVISAQYPGEGAAMVRFKPSGDRRLLPGQRLYLGAPSERADSYVDPRRAAIRRMNSVKLGSAARGTKGTPLDRAPNRSR